MIIIEKNEGIKIPYSVRGKKVTFNDDLTINLASREQDWPVHIDICFEEDRALVIGAAAGRAYVAESISLQGQIPRRLTVKYSALLFRWIWIPSASRFGQLSKGG